MEEQGIIRLRAIHKPVHRLDHICPSGDLPRISRVVGEHDDIFGAVIVAICRQPRIVIHGLVT